MNDRGLPISDEEFDLIKKERINELSKPEVKQDFWVEIGYVLALLGGFLGMFIGYHLYTFKKTLPNGEKIFNYSKNDRKHGRRILFISIISSIIWIAVKLIKFTN